MPANISADATQRLMRAAEQAHAALGCRGITRTDFKYDAATGKIAVIEVNTQPGMTPTSLAPEQAAYVGMSYDQLVGWILEDASWPR